MMIKYIARGIDVERRVKKVYRKQIYVHGDEFEGEGRGVPVSKIKDK